MGSNLEKPEAQLDRAINAISALPEVCLVRSSSRIRTAPYGRVLQPDFFNQVLEIESTLPPQQLMQQLLNIETAMGRIRKQKWGPRIIDIDILLAENLIVNTSKEPNNNNLPVVIIPHPDFHNRTFALQLLGELIPEYIHPVMQKSINELYCLISKPGGKQ